MRRRGLLQAFAGAAGSIAVGTGTVTAAETETNGGEVVWTYRTKWHVRSTPTVVDGTVYVGSQYLHAIDAATGTAEWVFEDAGTVQTSPAVVDGAVVAGTFDNANAVVALDAATGHLAWSYDAGAPVPSSPTVTDGTAYFGVHDGRVVALDLGSGDERWTVETDDEVWSSPTVVDGTVFVGSLDDRLYALDAATGDERWTVETGDDVWSSPTVADGAVYVGSDDGAVYALDAAAGNGQWTFETDGPVSSSPTVADGTVFVGSDDHRLYAIDAATGDRRWAFETETGVESSPTVAGDAVFVGGRERLYCLGVADGTERWRVEVTEADYGSTVVDGVCYVGDSFGRVYAIDAGVEGSSRGSRALLGTLGHHDEWARSAAAGVELTADGPYEYGTWFSNAGNADGATLDRRGWNPVTVRVGTEGNGGHFAFDPPAVHVDAGATVQFEWTGDGGGHSVAGRDDAIDSGGVYEEAGVNHEVTLEEDGIYRYVCEPHEATGMKGVVVVGDVEKRLRYVDPDSPTSTPTPTARPTPTNDSSTTVTDAAPVTESVEGEPTAGTATTSSNGPGFDVGSGLAGLAAAGLLWSRGASERED